MRERERKRKKEEEGTVQGYTRELYGDGGVVLTSSDHGLLGLASMKGCTVRKGQSLAITLY